LSSPKVEEGGELPPDYTGDGRGITPPLEWKGAPAGTRSYAIVMDHLDREGNKKWYWTQYDLPGSMTSLPEDGHDVGKLGTGFKGQVGYEPPRSQGPGAKTYTITVYALSAPLQIRQSPGEVDRELLIASMSGKVLASSSLNVVHTSGRRHRRRPDEARKLPHHLRRLRVSRPLHVARVNREEVRVAINRVRTV